jgi:2-keto-4-pentenoate hydratase/2-oxohepta-3-ene-1,7-dioic acid hydratase in catechol pathway
MAGPCADKGSCKNKFTFWREQPVVKVHRAAKLKNPNGGANRMKYVRYSYRGTTSYGVLDGENIRQIGGGLFGERLETGESLALGNAELLWPCEPTKILAVGLNYQSHLGDRPAPQNPEIFYVPTSALLPIAGEIRIPPDARNLHYEGELVIVIGRQTRQVTVSGAKDFIFGFTCGNDISERDWQKNDLQWWRAKGCDTFAPLGPAIATDFDWSRGQIETRVNGAVKQSGKFSDLLFNPLAIVSYVSRYLTLYPGDVIYTGTPGHTSALKPGDLVEVEIKGIGTLRNKVTA